MFLPTDAPRFLDRTAPTGPVRSGRPVTFGEALGVREGEGLELNACKAAVCAHCGAEPRLYTHASPRGREIAIWIPKEHRCPLKAAAS